MPQEIIDIFERHGFIWGGKWYHYDTMHFEYRPELTGLKPASQLPNTGHDDARGVANSWKPVMG
jgi:hypothetical protein